MSDVSPISPPNAPAAVEPCPTPLEWRQVLGEFREGGRAIAVERCGVPLSAFTFGRGDPLYFLNPAAGSHEQFALLAWLLREEFQCVFVEYRDQAPFSKAGSSLAPMADDVAALASHLQHDAFALCAVGFGSLPALQLMLAAPERIEAAVLVCGFAGRRYTWLERSLIEWGRILPGRVGSLPGWRRLQQQNHRPWFPPFDGSRWEFLADDLGATPTRQLARRLAIADAVDFRPRLGDIPVPTLLVRTEGEGQALTRCQDDLEAGLPRARSEWMHTSGHYPHLTHPHRLAKLLKAFVAESRSAPQLAAP